MDESDLIAPAIGTEPSEGNPTVAPSTTYMSRHPKSTSLEFLGEGRVTDSRNHGVLNALRLPVPDAIVTPRRMETTLAVET